MSDDLPEAIRMLAGDLPPPGRLPEGTAHPFETIRPVREGFVERSGVKSWYAVWGDSGPWIAFAPIFQITHSAALKATVPYLSHHFRVVTMDARGNGRSDRPSDPSAYTFDEFYRDFVAVLDAVGADRVAAVGISATAMTVLRLAAEQPERVTHVIVVGGFADARIDDPKAAERARAEGKRARSSPSASPSRTRRSRWRTGCASGGRPRARWSRCAGMAGTGTMSARSPGGFAARPW